MNGNKWSNKSVKSVQEESRIEEDAPRVKGNEVVEPATQDRR
jgi:hypothetical protein